MKATNHSFDDVDDEVTLKLISLASAAGADADDKIAKLKDQFVS